MFHESIKHGSSKNKYKTFEITFDLAFHIVFAFFFNNSKLFFCVSTRGEAAAAKKSSKVHAFNKKKICWNNQKRFCIKVKNKCNKLCCCKSWKKTLKIQKHILLFKIYVYALCSVLNSLWSLWINVLNDSCIVYLFYFF